MQPTRSSSLHRSVRLACALALVLALSGCMKVLYDRIDTFAVWYINGLVSLDETQRRDLHAWLEQTLQWHRGSELTRYAQFLRELSAAAVQPGTRETHERTLQRVEAFGTDLVAKTAPEGSRLLMRLSPEQVEQFVASLEEKSLERAEEDSEEIAGGFWHAKRAKATERQIKRWTGAVTQQQKALVREISSQLQPTSSDWLASQSQWRASLREALSDRSAPQHAEQRVLQLLREPDIEWTAQYKAKSAGNRVHILTLLQGLDASLTSAQRERLQRELIELAEQLEAMTET